MRISCSKFIAAKFNPYHDEQGRFSSGEGGPRAPDLSPLHLDPDTASPKQRRESKAALLALHSSSPESRDAMDAISIFTGGGFETVQQTSIQMASGEWETNVAKDRAKRSKDATGQDGAPVRAHPFGEVHDVTGAQLTSLTNPVANRAVPGVVNAIAESPVHEGTVYRGMYFHHREGDETPGRLRPSEWSSPEKVQELRDAWEATRKQPKYQEGQVLEWPAPVSFSRGEDVARGFSTGVLKEQGSRRGDPEAPFQTVLEIRGGAKGLHVDALSPWKKQREFITQGRFRVVSVEETPTIRVEYSRYGSHNVEGVLQHVVLEHIGVMKLEPSDLPPGPEHLVSDSRGPL